MAENSEQEERLGAAGAERLKGLAVLALAVVVVVVLVSRGGDSEPAETVEQQASPEPADLETTTTTAPSVTVTIEVPGPTTTLSLEEWCRQVDKKCGGHVPSTTISAATTTVAPATTSVAPATTTVAPTTTTTPADELPCDQQPLQAWQGPNCTLEELGYPAIGTIVSMEQGDVGCYPDLRSALTGEFFSPIGSFGLCFREDFTEETLVGVTSRFDYRVGGFSNCESEECDSEVYYWYLHDAIVLGEAWLVLESAEWSVSVGHLERWDGTNGTGDFTYVGCKLSWLERRDGSCRVLTGGTKTCTDTTCTTQWEGDSEFEVLYSLSSPITEDGSSPPRTLTVTYDGEPVQESAGLEVVLSWTD